MIWRDATEADDHPVLSWRPGPDRGTEAAAQREAQRLHPDPVHELLAARQDGHRFIPTEARDPWEQTVPYGESLASAPQAGAEGYEPGIPIQQPWTWEEARPWLVAGFALLLGLAAAWLRWGLH